MMLDPHPSILYNTRMNINENIWIEQLEIMGDILDEIREIEEKEQDTLTEEEIIREFYLDPRD